MSLTPEEWWQPSHMYELIVFFLDLDASLAQPDVAFSAPPYARLATRAECLRHALRSFVTTKTATVPHDMLNQLGFAVYVMPGGGAAEDTAAATPLEVARVHVSTEKLVDAAVDKFLRADARRDASPTAPLRLEAVAEALKEIAAKHPHRTTVRGICFVSRPNTEFLPPAADAAAAAATAPSSSSTPTTFLDIVALRPLSPAEHAAAEQLTAKRPAKAAPLLPGVKCCRVAAAHHGADVGAALTQLLTVWRGRSMQLLPRRVDLFSGVNAPSGVVIAPRSPVPSPVTAPTVPAPVPQHFQGAGAASPGVVAATAGAAVAAREVVWTSGGTGSTHSMPMPGVAVGVTKASGVGLSPLPPPAAGVATRGVVIGGLPEPMTLKVTAPPPTTGGTIGGVAAPASPKGGLKGSDSYMKY